MRVAQILCSSPWANWSIMQLLNITGFLAKKGRLSSREAASYHATGEAIYQLPLIVMMVLSMVSQRAGPIGPATGSHIVQGAFYLQIRCGYCRWAQAGEMYCCELCRVVAIRAACSDFSQMKAVMSEEIAVIPRGVGGMARCAFGVHIDRPGEPGWLSALTAGKWADITQL